MGGAKKKGRGKVPSIPYVPSVPTVMEETRIDPITQTVRDAPSKSWRVCPGKSVTSLRGIIGGGETVNPSDFSGGSDTMESLEQRKIIEMK